jgi:hypothetical protein
MLAGEWNSAATPHEGAIVEVLAADSLGQYVIPFPVLFRDDTWWNAGTGALLDATIVGWRPNIAKGALAGRKRSSAARDSRR